MWIHSYNSLPVELVRVLQKHIIPAFCLFCEWEFPPVTTVWCCIKYRYIVSYHVQNIGGSIGLWCTPRFPVLLKKHPADTTVLWQRRILCLFLVSVQRFISRRSSCASNSRQKAGRPEGGTRRVVCEQPVIETTKALNRQSISQIETSKSICIGRAVLCQWRDGQGWLGKGSLNHFLFYLMLPIQKEHPGKKTGKKKMRLNV